MLGNRIKSLREAKGLKQEELAQKVSVSPSAIGMYETNKREPNNEIILKLAEFFNVSTDYLLGKSDIRNPDKIDESKLNVAFESGYDGLNETNKTLINNIISTLKIQQDAEDKNIKENKSSNEKGDKNND